MKKSVVKYFDAHAWLSTAYNVETELEKKNLQMVTNIRFRIRFNI